MFPHLQFAEEDTLPDVTMGKVFLFDFNEQKYVLKDGRPVEATYEEAIKQWLTMLLITERDKYGVYDGYDFGIQLARFIGRKDIPMATITSEVSRQIAEAALLHPEVTGIENVIVMRDSGVATLRFDVITRRGIIEGIESEVKYNG